MMIEGEGPLTMTLLAEDIDVSRSSATGLVSRMEERGLVERLHDSADRRVVRGRLTHARRAATAEHELPHPRHTAPPLPLPPRHGGDQPPMTESSPAAAEAGFSGALRPAVEVSTRARNEILFAILLGLFLSALDQTIVGTALPRIVSDLRGNDLYTWVVTIYLITSTVTGPIYGKLSDLFGRRPMLMIGVSLFLIGSALSGLSQEMWQLILFRGIQGLGAGAIFPISLAVIGDLFTPAERGKYQGLFGAVFGVSALIGPALGGFLTDR